MSRLKKDSSPWPLWYRCNALLPTEQWIKARTLARRAGRFSWVHLRVSMQHYYRLPVAIQSKNEPLVFSVFSCSKIAFLPKTAYIRINNYVTRSVICSASTSPWQLEWCEHEVTNLCESNENTDWLEGQAKIFRTRCYEILAV